MISIYRCIDDDNDDDNEDDGFSSLRFCSGAPSTSAGAYGTKG